MLGHGGRRDMDWVAFGSVATAMGSVATAVALVFTRQQLRAGQDRSQTAFEDNLEREYRQITADIPVQAPLGAPLEAPLRRRRSGLLPLHRPDQPGSVPPQPTAHQARDLGKLAR